MAFKSPEFPQPLNVMDACLAVFEEAYWRHLADDENTKHVIVTGNFETIRLSDDREPYDIILYRPHINRDARPGISFWAARINTRRSADSYADYPYLLALEDDSSQFYVQAKQHDQLVPCGAQESEAVVDYLYRAKVMELEPF